MKFLTLNNLNENLKSFFINIVKPYVNKNQIVVSGLNFNKSFKIQVYGFMTENESNTDKFIFINEFGVPSKREEATKAIKLHSDERWTEVEIVNTDGENFPVDYPTRFPEYDMLMEEYSLLDLINYSYNN